MSNKEKILGKRIWWMEEDKPNSLNSLKSGDVIGVEITNSNTECIIAVEYADRLPKTVRDKLSCGYFTSGEDAFYSRNLKHFADTEEMQYREALGREVWWYNEYWELCSGLVTEVELMYTKAGENPFNEYRIKGTRDTHYTSSVRIEKCSMSEEEAIVKENERSASKLDEYCKKLSDIEALVRFMYSNTVNRVDGETDWEARQASRIAAKKLLGITLEE